MSERRLAVAAACLLALFACLAVAYRHEPVRGWDDAVARWVSTDLPASVEILARPFSWGGGGLGMAVVALVATGALLHRGRPREAFAVGVAYVAAESATQLLKVAFDRPRPALDPAVDLPGTAAFPSGHAAVSLAVLVTVAVALGRRGAVPWALAASFAVGLSRVALGVHWASDVLAGWALGGLVALAARLGSGCLRRHR